MMLTIFPVLLPATQHIKPESNNTNITNDAGFADVDWFRIEKVE